MPNRNHKENFEDPVKGEDAMLDLDKIPGELKWEFSSDEENYEDELEYLKLWIPKYFQTPQIKRTFNSFLPRALIMFIRKNNNYQNEDGNVSERFGTAGQFMKLSDKIEKLRVPLWDERGVGAELQFEDVEEVLMDMIGHVLLTADIYRKVREEKGID